MECKFDTFESEITTRINKALSQSEFRQLESNEWSELYIKFFLNIYLQICDIPGIRYVSHPNKTFEPITLHVDPQQQKQDTPQVIHSISTLFLKSVFEFKSYRMIEASQKCTLKMPNIFPLVNSTSQFAHQSKVLNSFVSNKLLHYYVVADHAAYHYLQFMAHGDADYQHNKIKNRPSNVKPGNVKHCHDIVTLAPNKYISKFLQSHSTLDVEDLEVSKSHINLRYGELFQSKSEDDEDSDTDQ